NCAMEGRFTLHGTADSSPLRGYARQPFGRSATPPQPERERVVPGWEDVVMARGFPYADLNDFLAALRQAGDLHHVAAPVDPHLEISEIVTRTVRAGGPALVFDHPTRGEMPVAINLFGTERRMALALGVERLDEVGARIGELVKPELPVGWAGI